MLETLERPGQSGEPTFLHYVRDAVRSAKGKSQKHTLPHGSRETASGVGSHQAPVKYNFDGYTVSDGEWELLEAMIKRSADFPGPIVEVGVLAGRTTQRIAAAKQPSQQILAVDNFCWNGWGFTPEEHWSLVQLSLGYLSATGHVQICKIDKDEFYRTYDGPAPSLVFLDAMHTYEETKKDIEWAREVGAKIICGHDYKDEFPGVIQIVDELGGPKLLSESLFVLDDAVRS